MRCEKLLPPFEKGGAKTSISLRHKSRVCCKNIVCQSFLRAWGLFYKKASRLFISEYFPRFSNINRVKAARRGIMDENLERIIKFLPLGIRDDVFSFCARLDDGGKNVTEVRLRAEMPVSLTIDGKNVTCFDGKTLVCLPAELSDTLGRLCEDSVHTYSETIKEGYVFLSGGYRIGVCGSARKEGEHVAGIYSVSSLCIRIPHCIYGACGGLLNEIRRGDAVLPTLLYSPPGVGKTTLLRDAAATISSGRDALRVCIIDTRGEIYIKEMFEKSICDVLLGYPRWKGMEIGARTLSAQVIVCDEIGTDEECAAILSVQNCGVPLLATAHAASFEGLMKRPNIKKLTDAGVFGKIIGISRKGGDFSLSVRTV